MNEQPIRFWINEEGKPSKINQSRLILYLDSLGYANLLINPTNYILVKCVKNKISRTSEHEIISQINAYLKHNASDEVQEIFARGVGNYVSAKKLTLLDILEFKKERDDKKSSDFFFKNIFCNVTKDEIRVLDYQDLSSVIWENKINKRDFTLPSSDDKIGDFEVFCKNLTFNDSDRFLAFKTMIGYLLHRNKELEDPKAVILYDERMGVNKQAHGGTGKTLIIKALEMCRESVYVSGKELKTGSFFKNQRIEITTDLVTYDDLKENVQFEDFYTMVTSGIEVEKKGKQSFLIEFDDAPKILLSSNYLIKGDGGNSDLRRRHEFEIANHYNKDYTPEMEFGKRFFSKDWGEDQWNKFYYFMMSCLQCYLENGLIEADPINLEKTKSTSKSSPEFVIYADKFCSVNELINKREFQKEFEERYPTVESVSPHRFKKWVTDYSIDKGYEYKSYSSGGEYLFILEKKEVQYAS
jgi:hypothetical protein